MSDLSPRKRRMDDDPDFGNDGLSVKRSKDFEDSRYVGGKAKMVIRRKTVKEEQKSFMASWMGKCVT